MIRTHRSKIVAPFGCPRYLFHKYYNGEKGLQKSTVGMPALAGLHIHEVNARILCEGAEHRDNIIGQVLAKYGEQFKSGCGGIPFAQTILTEQKNLIEGIGRAFARVRVPQLRAMGTVTHVEQEMKVRLSDEVEFEWRADAIIEAEEGLIVVDFKPTASGDYEFVRKWERDSQVLAYANAARRAFPTHPILGVQIEGYMKGRRRKSDDICGGQLKVQQSPTCYVYVNDFSGQISPIYQRAGDWTYTPLTDVMSVKEFVEELLTVGEIERLLLSPLPAICPPPQRLDDWEEQTLYNEVEWERKGELVRHVHDCADERAYLKVLNQAFPKNTDNCFKYGEEYPCEFDGLCFNSEVAADPIGSGLYEDRVDHHSSEETK